MQEVDTRRSSTWVPDSRPMCKGEYPHRIDEIRAVVKGLTSKRRRKASIRIEPDSRLGDDAGDLEGVIHNRVSYSRSCTGIEDATPSA